MKRLFFVLLVLACSAAPLRAAGLQLSIRDGMVSIDAQDVTIRQILTEWARVGQTRIVNLERLNGGPITIKFDGVPEKQALDIVLRTLPGYMAAPRATLVANASVYDTILVMATTTPVAALRPPNPGFPAPLRGAGNVTELRQSPQGLYPGVRPDFPDPALDPEDDQAIAAAAAAGLIAVPASMPGFSTVPPAMMPGGMPQTGVDPNGPAVATPSNPWNAPAGTSQPSPASPPTPAGTAPLMQPRADQ